MLCFAVLYFLTLVDLLLVCLPVCSVRSFSWLVGCFYCLLSVSLSSSLIYGSEDVVGPLFSVILHHGTVCKGKRGKSSKVGKKLEPATCKSGNQKGWTMIQQTWRRIWCASDARKYWYVKRVWKVLRRLNMAFWNKSNSLKYSKRCSPKKFVRKVSSRSKLPFQGN